MNLVSCATLLAACAVAATAAAGSLPPKLAAFMQRAQTDPAGVAEELRSSPISQIAKPFKGSTNPKATPNQSVRPDGTRPSALYTAFPAVSAAVYLVARAHTIIDESKLQR